MADLMDQDVVQVEVAKCVLCPGKSPQLAVLSPDSAVHLCLDDLFGLGRTSVGFDERLFDGVKINVRTPLQPVARKERSLASHSGEFDNFDILSVPCRQLLNAIANFFDRHWVNVTIAGISAVKIDHIGVGRFVPLIVSVELVAFLAGVGTSLSERSGRTSAGCSTPLGDSAWCRLAAF